MIIISAQPRHVTNETRISTVSVTHTCHTYPCCLFENPFRIPLQGKYISDVVNLKTEYESQKSGSAVAANQIADNYKRSTLVPPLIAALSSDLVIHSALSSGTAAIECAQKKIPTILIDREKAVKSKLNELPKNKIIFDNFENAIEALKNHFFQNKPIEGFGDWSKYIYEFDPFNDDQGAFRIGSYLNKIIDGYNQSLKKEDILSLAASEYSQKWGKDKIIY